MPLHVHRYGPADRSPAVLALHGLTGHGARWRTIADQELPGVRVLAPDLRGHGRSPWEPPWTIEQHVADLAALLDAETEAPVLLVGHSFGGVIATHLARTAPERFRALVLLDPAPGLDPELCLRIAELTLASPDYTDAAEARSDKANTGWSDVPPEVLDAELTEHLIPTTNGRVGWRVSPVAAIASWGELARPFVLPPTQLPTVLVQAGRSQPPVVQAEFRAALTRALGDRLTCYDVDCGHMVTQARPDVVGEILRKLL